MHTQSFNSSKTTLVRRRNRTGCNHGVPGFRRYDFEDTATSCHGAGPPHTRKIGISIFSYQKVRSVLIATHLATLNYCLLDYRIATRDPYSGQFLSHLSFIHEITNVLTGQRFSRNYFRV